jgi:hypothetical protein
MRRKDALLIAFFSGTLIMISIMLFVLLAIPDTMLNMVEGQASKAIFSNLYTFRFFFMMIFILAAAGVAVKILRKYRINYMYIFEFDP